MTGRALFCKSKIQYLLENLPENNVSDLGYYLKDIKFTDALNIQLYRKSVADQLHVSHSQSISSAVGIGTYSKI
jgi:hypothetical protein